MILSQAQIDDIEPPTEDYLLRCDIFEAVGWSLPPASSLYVVLAWGPTERRSAAQTGKNGKIIFESPLVTKTGYYELLDQIEADIVPQPEQQYDVFLHPSEFKGAVACSRSSGHQPLQRPACLHKGCPSGL